MSEQVGLIEWVDGTKTLKTLIEEEARAREAGGLVVSGGVPQVNTLLGSLRTDLQFETDAFQSEWAKALPQTPPPSAGELWLIFRWEGLATVAGFARASQQRAWWDLDGSKSRVRSQNASGFF